MTQSTEPGAIPFPKKGETRDVVYDLMRGGPGTPWENRGEHGGVGGFAKSAVRATFKPGLLFDHIRDTTTTAQANVFLWVCAACWGAGAATWRVIQYVRIDQTKFNVDGYTYGVRTAIETAVTVVVAFGLFRLITGLYHKLVQTEIKQPVPASLTTNVVAYAMGPSLFAPIPLVGPLVALAGCFAALVAAGRKRLYISWRAAVIDALLAFAAAVVLSLVAYFVLDLLLDQVLSAVERVPPPTLPRR